MSIYCSFYNLTLLIIWFYRDEAFISGSFRPCNLVELTVKFYRYFCYLEFDIYAL